MIVDKDTLNTEPVSGIDWLHDRVIRAHQNRDAEPFPQATEEQKQDMEYTCPEQYKR